MDKLESLLNDVVTRCLTNLFGSDAAMAMNYRLNPNLAAYDPDAYESRLNSLIGEKPADIILRRIEHSLCERVGLEKREWESLARCLEAAKPRILGDNFA